ncbi:oxidoreductase ion channel protein IolS [Lentibacillus kapialis]|uniref:Oxidoreductase ion channel protein IolS n=1 Tax=Lentibacillus kapialis TaxID=340214 RepID=A0A917Q2Z9_9BACI|nr:aldo/keto reductase [Lentibacillus kapialis]GGK05977.1 oxidoreductase ion channel protein IolS [Lentibacillus kapialis]
MNRQVYLGQSDIRVYPVGLGTNAVGGHNIYPNMLDEEQGKDMVRAALDDGMNMLDTAYMYGLGRSEELIGDVMNEYKREDIALATKGAHEFVGDDIVMNNHPTFLKQQVENSMRRLQTDYIDLFYIHYPDKDTPKYEAVGALKELRDQGKIRSIGVSNFSMDELKEANQDGYVDVVQAEYNLLHREAETIMLPYTAEQAITFIPYFPLESGLLAGKYDASSTFTDIRASKPSFQGEAFRENLKKVDKLRDIANDYGEDVAHVVLAWYFSRSSLDVVIPGAKRAGQVTDNKRAGEIELTQETIDTIDRLFG